LPQLLHGLVKETISMSTEDASALELSVRSGDPEEVRRQADLFLSHNFDSTILHHAAAVAYGLVGLDLESALEILVAIILSPDNYAAQLSGARLLVKQGMREHAKLVLERAWEIRSRDLREVDAVAREAFFKSVLDLEEK